MSNKRSGSPAKRAWQPMTRGTLNPAMAVLRDGSKEAWGNDLYQCVVQYDGDSRDGAICLTIKRHDRSAVRDWRHLQQIKNEVAGLDREAVELFPDEARLMDTSNQYWLWVAPAGDRFDLGFDLGAVADDESVEVFNSIPGGKGRQRPWQPGLTTGRNELSPIIDVDDAADTLALIQQAGR